MADSKGHREEAKSMIDKEDVRAHGTHSMAEASTPEHIHEHSDVQVRPILLYAVILVVGVVVIQLGLWGVFELLEDRAEAADPVVSPMRDTVRTLSEPPLQADPPADLDAYLRAQDSMLRSYGWVDKNLGMVHIPIETAMDRLAESGLPWREPDTQHQAVVIDASVLEGAGGTTATPVAAPAVQAPGDTAAR